VGYRFETASCRLREADTWKGIHPFATGDRRFESISLHQRVINEPGKANWAINSLVAEEDRYLLANARASWLTAKPLPAGARSRFTKSIPRGDPFIPSPLIQGPDSPFDLRIADYQKAPTLHVAAARAQTPASRIFRISSFGTGSGFSRRIDRVVRMISNRSVPVLWFSFGIMSLAGVRLGQPSLSDATA
jgi:hypothetical protein